MMEAALKQDIVTETVRGWIMDGKYQPGQKLPTDAELSHLFQVNKCTIAAGLNRLVDENILDRAPRRGSIVKKQDQAPVTNGVALVMPHEGEVYSDLSRDLGVCLSKENLYPILVNHLFSNDHDEIISFLSRMTSQSLPFGYMCIGGSFFPYDLFRKNPLHYRNIVFLMSYCGKEEIPGCRCALIDYVGLGAQVVQYFAERNIKRILFPAHHERSFSNHYISLQVTIMQEIKKQAAVEGIEFDEGFFWRTHYGVPCKDLLPDAISAGKGKLGIFSYTDNKLVENVLPVLQQMKMEEDVVLLGNYNTKWSRKYHFDSFDMRVDELARIGVDMLTGNCQEQKVLLPAKLIKNSKTEEKYEKK